MRPSSIRYAAMFFTLGAVIVAAALSTLPGNLGWVAIGASVAFVILGLAYAIRRPVLLGKRQDGRLHTVPLLLMLPYHALNAMTFGLYRMAEKAPPWAQVSDRLFWGRRLTSGEAAEMPATHVLDLTCEFSECPALRGRKYRSVAMLDGTAPTIAQLTQAVNWLRESVACGPTYVHCALGHGRSGTVVLAYMISEGRVASVEEGLAWLRSIRAKATLSRGQCDILRQWAVQSHRSGE